MKRTTAIGSAVDVAATRHWADLAAKNGLLDEPIQIKAALFPRTVARVLP